MKTIEMNWEERGELIVLLRAGLCTWLENRSASESATTTEYIRKEIRMQCALLRKLGYRPACAARKAATFA